VAGPARAETQLLCELWKPEPQNDAEYAAVSSPVVDADAAARSSAQVAASSVTSLRSGERCDILPWTVSTDEAEEEEEAGHVRSAPSAD
jgi:hypothetical protein